MAINYLQTTDPYNKIGKSFTVLGTDNINIFKSVDLIRPTITIGYPSYPNFNYVLIDELSRYYSVQDIIPIGGDCYSLVLEVDVLETYKDNILGKYGSINRKSKQGDAVVGDIKSGYDKIITEIVGDIDFSDSLSIVVSTTSGAN